MALPFRLDLLSSGDGDALLQREILELLGPKEVPSQAFEQGVRLKFYSAASANDLGVTDHTDR